MPSCICSRCPRSSQPFPVFLRSWSFSLPGSSDADYEQQGSPSAGCRTSAAFSPSLFARIVAGHEAPHDKPYREHILYSLEGLLKPEEITPENVWMIGDSAQDSDCALAANALPIRIGEPIWHDDNPKDGRIKYFHDFKAFYQALIAAGC